MAEKRLTAGERTALLAEQKKRIGKLSGSQAKIALMVIHEGGDMQQALDVAETYPEGGVSWQRN